MRSSVFLLAALISVLGVVSGSASTITLSKKVAGDYFGGGGNRLVSNISNRPGVQGRAGGLSLSDGSNDILAWCLDVANNLVLPGLYTVTTTPFSATTGDLTATRVDAIRNLFEVNFSTLVRDHSPLGNDQSAGFQMALWELVYENSDSYDVTAGSWQILSVSNALGWANTFLANLGGAITQQYRLTFFEASLDAEGHQLSQNLVSVTAVPLPPAGLLLGVGLLGLVGIGRLKRGGFGASEPVPIAEGLGADSAAHP